MSAFYPLLGAALCATLALTACSQDALETPVAEPQAPVALVAEVQSFDASLFPKPDKSDLLGNNGATVLRKLLVKVDHARCFERSKLDITDEQYAKVKAFADALVAQCKDDAEKVRTIYDWVSHNISYGYYDNSAWAVFTNRKAVCQGYSNLCRVMLHSQGIPSVTVNGMYVNVGAHAWNYAYDGKQWVVLDATNKGYFVMSNSASYQHLQPEMADIDLFEDEQFVYNFNEGQLNICRVKQASDVLVIPYSINGFCIGLFNPTVAIPSSVQAIYLGKNIRSLGRDIIGLAHYPSHDQMVYVDPANSKLGSEEGIVYRRSGKRLTSLYYIPPRMRVAKLIAMKTVGKNLIFGHPHLEEIVFAEGTERLEAYAIEKCPSLRVVYVPTECVLEEDALYACPENVEVVRGNTTGIARIRL